MPDPQTGASCEVLPDRQHSKRGGRRLFVLSNLRVAGRLKLDSIGVVIDIANAKEDSDGKGFPV